MYSEKAGHLDVGRQVRGGGKVVDTWVFRSPFTEHGDGPKPPKLVVDIVIVKSEGGIVFEARSDSLPKRGFQDRDIEALRQKVEDALHFQHEMLTNVTWENWLEIAVVGSQTDGRTYEGIQANVQLKYTFLKRGVDPKTGRAYVINSNHIAVEFPRPKKAGEKDPEHEDKYGFNLGGRDLNTEYSYLPATPENLAALQDLQCRINELRLRMAEFLNQGTVQQSLANLASGALVLPAPL